MRLFLHQLRAEQKLFWRSRELAFFTFLLPIVFFLMLGSAYGDEEIEGVSGYTFLLAGMIGYGAAATTFAGLALLLVIRRESGVLKRLRATPLPAGDVHRAPCSPRSSSIFLLEAAILIALGAVRLRRAARRVDRLPGRRAAARRRPRSLRSGSA